MRIASPITHHGEYVGTWHSNVNVIRSYYRQQTESTQPSHSSTYTETHDTTRSSSGRLRPYQSISECRLSSTLGRRHADHAPDPHHARAHVAISVQAPSAPGEHPGLGSRGKAERQRGYSAAHQYVFSSDEMRI